MNEVEEDRIRAARVEVCRNAADASGEDWPIYIAAVETDPTIGPEGEIAKVCNIFIAGILYRLGQERKQLENELYGTPSTKR